LSSDEQTAPAHLILELFSAFIWFDEGLQGRLRAAGWPQVTRPQSMVMCALALGLHRPSDIARRLGVSRQAIHTTIGQLVDKGVLELVDDPADRRIKTVELSAQGEAMKRDAQAAMAVLVEALTRRIGARRVAALRQALLADWGEPPAAS
jgi:DNA-binding MarR family transcriptional regulator